MIGQLPKQSAPLRSVVLGASLQELSWPNFRQRVNTGHGFSWNLNPAIALGIADQYALAFTIAGFRWFFPFFFSRSG
jgi:hypothetical protein